MPGNAAASLDQYFEVVRVRTPALLEQVYRVRYQVYCIEHAFEDATQYPSHLETDAFDAISEHVALLYRPTREVVGTVRLILPTIEETTLPIFKALGPEESRRLRTYPRNQLAEISRYAVAKTFRRRLGEGEYPDIELPCRAAQADRRLLPHLTLGLMRAVLTISIATNIDYLCACMRPALLRLLRSAGLEFQHLGGLVDVHGLRQPCVGARSVLLEGLKAQRPEWFEIVDRRF
jgi:N-acyl amino acid synthase of PEP-CTERM/exosortase system